jgi:hypothetical protein
LRAPRGATSRAIEWRRRRQKSNESVESENEAASGMKAGGGVVAK